MKKKIVHSLEEVVVGAMQQLEEEAGSSIFTMRVIEQPEREELHLLAVFENRAVFHRILRIETLQPEGLTGTRIMGDFI